MSLGAHTNKVGGYEDVGEIQTSFTSGSNPASNWQSKDIYVRAYSFKSSPIKVNWAPIAGTSTLWRGPTPYRRAIWRVSNNSHRAVITYSPTVQDVYVQSVYPTRLGNGPELMAMGPCFPWTGADAEFDTNDRNRARTECLLKLGDQKVNLLNNLGTARQTLDLVSENTLKLIGAYRAARRGNFGLVAKSLGLDRKSVLSGKTAASRWLEYKYGWQPLMGDIYAGIEAFKTQLPDADLISARRNVKNRYDLDHDVRGIRVKGSVSTSHVCHLTAMVSDNYKRRANKIGVLNPLTVAWEVLPWSFLVDWVMPIGSMLEAMSASSGLTFVSGYESVKAEGSTMRSRDGSPAPNYHPYAESKLERFGFKREVFSDFPLPGLYVKSPFSTGHMQNALALIRTLVR